MANCLDSKDFQKFYCDIDSWIKNVSLGLEKWWNGISKDRQEHIFNCYQCKKAIKKECKDGIFRLFQKKMQYNALLFRIHLFIFVKNGGIVDGVNLYVEDRIIKAYNYDMDKIKQVMSLMSLMPLQIENIQELSILCKKHRTTLARQRAKIHQALQTLNNFLENKLGVTSC